MIETIAGVFLLFAAYWLPGAAFSTLVEWKGLARPVRWMLPFVISWIVIPLGLNLVAEFWPQPPLLPVAIGWTILAIGLSWILRRFGKRPVLEFRSRHHIPVSRKEGWLVGIFLMAFSAMAMLPRISMLWNGSGIPSVLFSDVYWHLSELTAIARSGLPPQHFLFPDVPLVYYYNSWRSYRRCRCSPHPSSGS